MSDDKKPRPPTRVNLPASTDREEGNEALHLGQSRVLGTRVTHVENRVDKVEGVLGVPRPAPRPPPARSAVIVPRERLPSDAEHHAKQAEDGMIQHTKRLEGAVQKLTENGEHLAANDSNQNDTLADHNVAFLIIARELGIESKLPPRMQKSLPPPATGASPPLPPVLGRIESRAKRSQTVQFVIAAGIVVQAIRELVLFLLPHH